MAVVSNKNYGQVFFSALLAASVIGLFLHFRESVLDAFVGVHLFWIVAGLICFLANYLARATRIHLLTQKKLSVFPGAIYCSTLHGFATYMLPVRAGELSLPFILKSRANIELTEGAKILYKARLLDVFILGIWLILAAILPGSSLQLIYRAAMAVLGCAMVSAPFVLGKCSTMILSPFPRFKGIARAVAESSGFDRNELLITFAIWFASAAMLWCITASMHLTLSVDQLFFLVAVQLALQLVPLQGFANSGNHEGGWMAAMIVIGYSAEVALKISLATHIVVLVFVLFLGLLALLFRFVDTGS